jgi:hypothetical protein
MIGRNFIFELVWKMATPAPRPFSVLDPSVKIRMVLHGSELGVVKLFNYNGHSKMGEVVY